MKCHYCIDFSTISDNVGDCSNPARMITLQLTCLHIFGDLDMHEIETCWIQKNQGLSAGSECYRIVIGDKDITDITYERGSILNDKPVSIATITLHWRNCT